MNKPLITPLLVPIIALSACGAEAEKDANTREQVVDRSPALVIAMPDHFSNVATKCDHHGHRVYTTTHGSEAAPGLTVVPDPECK